MPIISLIVPVYNTEKYLKRCLDSILAQTFSDFELILIDDGSTDSSGKICDDYAKEDNRITVFHQENKGQATARNYGLDWVYANSNSKWINLIDSDDAVHPRMLEILYKYACCAESKLIVGDLVSFRNSDSLEYEQIDSNFVKTTLSSPEDFFVNNHYIEVSPCCKLYSRSCFENIRYPDGKIHEDNFTTYKIIFALDMILHVEAPLYYRYINHESTTRSTWSPKRLSVFEAYNEQIDYFEANNYFRAKEKIVIHAAEVMCNQLREVQKTDNYHNYQKVLKKMLQVHLKKYRNYDGIRNNAYLYSVAYPKKQRMLKRMAGFKGIIKSKIVGMCLPSDGRIGFFGKKYINYKIRKNVNNQTSDENTFPIDFVVTWVDNQDPKWLSLKHKYETQTDHTTRKDNSEARYRNWDVFHYWFRAIEKYAPWVRNVFLITNEQVPKWLNTKHPKLRLISHKEFIPDEYLPTFNSRVIELNLWRIKDLSEHFVYFNDDVYLSHNVTPEDFFYNGLPKYSADTKPNYAYSKMGSFDHALWNNLGEINTRFSVRDVIKRNPEKWLSDNLQGYYEYNLRTYRDNYLSGMYFSHVCVPFRKSAMKECADNFADAFRCTCSNRFRTFSDINHQIFQIWEMMNGTFEPVDRNYYGYAKNITLDTIEQISDKMLNQDCLCVCINDSEQCSEEDYKVLKVRLCALLQEKYPEKSSFEK